MLVKALIVIAMAALHLSIVPRCSRTNTFMFNAQFQTEKIKRVYLLSFSKMSELKTIIGLKDFRLIAKMFNGHIEKLNRGVRGLFFEWE